MLPCAVPRNISVLSCKLVPATQANSCRPNLAGDATTKGEHGMLQPTDDEDAKKVRYVVFLHILAHHTLKPSKKSLSWAKQAAIYGETRGLGHGTVRNAPTIMSGFSTKIVVGGSAWVPIMHMIAVCSPF